MVGNDMCDNMCNRITFVGTVLAFVNKLEDLEK